MALTQVSTDGVKDGSLLNADINASAAIDGSKITPTFTSTVNVTNTLPEIFLTDTNTSNARGRLNANAGSLLLGADNDNAAADSVISFAVDGGEKARIDTSGRLLLGTTTEGHANGDDLTIATSGNTGLTIRSGTSSSGNIYFSDGTSGDDEYRGFVSYGHNVDGMYFATNASTRMFIDSSGQIGIGTTSPASPIHSHLASSDANRIRVTNSTTGATASDGFIVGLTSAEEGIVWNYENSDMLFGTNNAERMRIDSSGRLQIGTTVGWGSNCKLHVSDTSSNCFITISAADNGNSVLAFSDTAATVRGALDYDHDGDFLGIKTAGSERMRIDSSGRVLIGTSISDSPATSGKLQMGINGTSGNAACLFDYGGYNTGILYMQHARAGANSNAFSGIMIDFRNTNNSQVGKIHADVGATMYATSSDYRLKENVVAISDGITRLKTLKPYRFNWKVDKNRTIDGFLAHEVTAVPEAISGTKDGVDENGDPDYQTIDQSKLVPLLTAALQEAVAKIEVLESKVAALEAA